MATELSESLAMVNEHVEQSVELEFEPTLSDQEEDGEIRPETTDQAKTSEHEKDLSLTVEARRQFQVDEDTTFPDWADPELSEDWLSQPGSPVASARENSGTLGSRKTTSSVSTGDGTTRIVTGKAATENKSATPEWKKISAPRDIFSPLSLERMFASGVDDQSSGSRLRRSKDSHSRLQASLTRLKSELAKVSPIQPVPYKKQTTDNRALDTTRNSLRGHHQMNSTHRHTSTISEESYSEHEIDNKENMTKVNTEEDNVINSPHPPQQRNFNFTVPRSSMAVHRQPFSPSKLKIFQNRDTLSSTNAEEQETLGENLETSSAFGEDQEATIDSVLIKPLSPYKERSPKRARLDMSKSVVTTQDFMSQAEHIMDMLRSLKKPTDSVATDDELSQRQSEMTESSQPGMLESVSESPERRHKVSEQSSSSRSSSLSSQSRHAYDTLREARDEDEGLDPDSVLPRNDLYYNSIRNRYETSSTKMGINTNRGKRQSNMGLSPMSTIPTSTQQEDRRQISEQERASQQQSPVQRGLGNVNVLSPSKRLNTASPRSGEVQLTPNDRNANSKKGSTEPMKVILKEHVEKLIPATFGPMVFDPENSRWVKKSTESGSSGNVEDEDDEDVFRGIDDLMDDSTFKAKEQHGHQVFIDEYRNSLQRSLSSLEEDMSRKTGNRSASTSRTQSPQKRDQYRQPQRSNPRMQKENVPLRCDRPEVSFAFPPAEQQTYYADMSYVGARHDATAVSQLESSFSIAVQNLVKVLTDIQPFEVHWEDIVNLDLQGRELETLVRLEDWCPSIVELDVSKNDLAYLTGVPESTRTLRAGSNNLSELTAFGFMWNLQYLNLSDNHIETLDGMSRLVHLRELVIDNNDIYSVDGIMQLDGLLRLSARGNKIASIGFESSTLTRLEEMDLSSNRLRSIDGLIVLQRLMLLNLNNNLLKTVDPDGYMPKLRTLKITKNALKEFDASAFPNLRVLSLDNNRLRAVSGLRKLRLLESLSIRDQHNPTNEVWCEDISDVRKLYLSGNIPKELTFQEHFLNLQTLELASVQLKKLPSKFSDYVANLRDLNLSFNELTDLSGLRGIPKLRRLYAIGNQFNLTEHLARVLSTCPSLQVLDLRMNPLTLQFYPPVIGDRNDKSSSARKEKLSESERKNLYRQYNLVMSRKSQIEWEQKDKQFELHLPKLSLMKRKAYQGLIFLSTQNLQWLDGVEFSKTDVHEASGILEKITLNVERGLRRA
ncbi:hypothetical protein V1512DRAFT_248796 [Lipomyces arxii]|uniref:uncharacterized protein n=1 Tax=Lipomyces arxii TaxID=56418 RepID=UPI0034CF77C0